VFEPLKWKHVSDGSVAEAISKAEMLGSKYGINGTLAWLLDHHLITGLRPAAEFERLAEDFKQLSNDDGFHAGLFISNQYREGLLGDIPVGLADGGGIDQALGLSRKQGTTTTLFNIAGDRISSPAQRTPIALSARCSRRSAHRGDGMDWRFFVHRGPVVFYLGESRARA
jgi:hypothetical protein